MAAGEREVAVVDDETQRRRVEVFAREFDAAEGAPLADAHARDRIGTRDARPYAQPFEGQPGAPRQRHRPPVGLAGGRFTGIEHARAYAASGQRQQSFSEALKEAFSHRSYNLLVIGFFTCGFQLAFVTVHFQRYIVEAGLPANVGYWAFALVGIFNIVGSMGSGWLASRFPKRWVR